MGKDDDDDKKKKKKKSRKHKHKSNDSYSSDSSQPSTRDKQKKKKSKHEHQVEEDEWVEMAAATEPAQEISTFDAAYDELMKNKEASTQQRDEWMLRPMESTYMTQQREKQGLLQQAQDDTKEMSIAQQRELNPDINPERTALAPSKPSSSRGNAWTIMKVNKVYEIAERDKRPLEQVAMERFGNLDDFYDAVALRDGVPREDPDKATRKSNKSKFKNPEAEPAPVTMPPSAPSAPTLTRVAVVTPCLSLDELNRMKSKWMKAKIMNLPDAENMEKEYQEQRRLYELSKQDTRVLSNVDSQGRLIDIGKDEEIKKSGKKSKNEKFEAFDKEGNRLRYAADDDKKSITDLLREEKTHTLSYNDMMANSITKDARFNDDLEYMDEVADKMMRGPSEKKKRNMAIQGKKNKKHLSELDYTLGQKSRQACPFCIDEGQTSALATVAAGSRVYLALPETIPIVPGHCLIVPSQHVVNCLECDDETWDEIRNFMKCTMRMFAQENKGAIFMEQALFFKKQRHSVIECIPLPAEHYEHAPAFFKEAILSSDEEWSQHKKLIDTTKYGIRKSMVKNLPYFHVWFDPNRGYGHVIEDEASWTSWFGKASRSDMIKE